MAKMLQPKPKPKAVVKPKVAPKKGGPTYKNLPLGVSLEQEERTGYRSEGSKPTKQDSAAYKYGYNLGKKGVKSFPNESPIGRVGRWEGLNEKPAAKKKMQAGGKLKMSSPDSLYKLVNTQIKKESTNKTNLNNKFKEKQDSLKSEFQKGLIKMKSKTKMQAGGVMKPAKRVGPIDPNGAWTKVQERTIAGKKAPKVPLKKDKQLDASKIERKQAGGGKMKMGGSVKKK